MSSILKALRKLEHEKTSRFPGSLHIDSDILRGSDSSRGFSPFVTVLLFLIVFGGGAAVSYFFMAGTKATLTAAKQQPVVTATNNPPPVVPPSALSETLPAEIIVVPAQREPFGATPGNRQQITDFSGEMPITGKPARTVVSNSPARHQEVTETTNNHPSAVAAAPTLRVNGIAFQSSSADRMAIVNGTPVSNGSIIENSTVEEIRTDRVLFKRNGEKFEILLGQSD